MLGSLCLDNQALADLHTGPGCSSFSAWICLLRLDLRIDRGDEVRGGIAMLVFVLRVLCGAEAAGDVFWIENHQNLVLATARLLCIQFHYSVFSMLAGWASFGLSTSSAVQVALVGEPASPGPRGGQKPSRYVPLLLCERLLRS